MKRVHPVPRTLRYEWVRLTTLISTWLLAAAAVAVTALAARGYGVTLTAFTAGGTVVPSQEVLLAVIGNASFAPLAAGIFGVLAAGGDYRQGTARVMHAVTVACPQSVGAKALVAAVFSLAVMACATATSWAVAGVTLPTELISTATYRDLLVLHGGLLLQTTCWTLLGIAITVVFRSQTIGVVSFVVIPYMLEPMIRMSILLAGPPWLTQVARYLPFTASTSMSNIAGEKGTFLADASQRLTPGAAVLVFGLFTAVLLAAAVARLRRQGA